MVFNVGGLPLTVLLGIITYVLLLLTFLTNFLTRRGLVKIPLKYHIRLAYLTMLSATLHVISVIWRYYLS